jgi:PAS domain S-box-containing protein
LAASVLIVEDEELVAYTLGQILTDEGYQVERAANAAEALARIARQRFDVALLDLQVGDDSGLAVLAQVKKTSPGTVALILTGYGSLKTAIQAMRQGAFDYLLKPCDVEELKAAILRGLEQRFRSIIQHAADIVMIVDRGANVRYVSPAVEQILGYRPDEVADAGLAAIIMPDDLGPDRASFLQHLARSNPQAPVQLHARHRDGSHRVLEAVASDLRDDRSVGGVVVNARDITERKRAEDALRLLSEASRVLAGSLDYRTTLASVVNLAVPELADWSSVHTIEDGSVRRMALAHRDPQTLQRLEELRRRYPLGLDDPHPVARVLRTGRPEFHPVVPRELLLAIAQDAEHLELLQELGLESYMAVPLQARGRILGAMTFISVRERRQYGREDLALAEELARRAALAVDNARLYGEVQQGIRARDDFLSSVAHDLRTPLTSIKGFTQMLLHRVERSAASEPGVADGLAQIDAAATRMTGVISMLVDLARLQLGQPLELDCRPLDLVALTGRIVVAQPTDRSPVRFEADIDELIGSWDAQRLERAIEDLLSNARKYDSEGSPILVRVSREEDSTGSWAVLCVRDNGLGIPAADLPRIFDRFYRAANVAGRVDGAGIGLTDARQIVEQHGGTLAVASTEGEGTTATLRLPLR